MYVCRRPAGVGGGGIYLPHPLAQRLKHKRRDIIIRVGSLAPSCVWRGNKNQQRGGDNAERR